MVIFIDGASHCAQRVVAVGHCVRQREFLQTRGAGCLYDAHISDVVAHHGIETDAHLVALGAVYVVAPQNGIGDCVFACLLRRRKSRGVGCYRIAVKQIHAFVNQFNHDFRF